MNGNKYGYVRVSSKTQSLDRQVLALFDAGVDNNHIYQDKATGKDFNRQGYKKMIDSLKEGDTVIITSIDRLGRNYKEIQAEWKKITSDIKASIVVLDIPFLDTRIKKNDITQSLIADIMLQVLAYVAHVERDYIKQRQAEGIAAAKAKGVTFGRPKIKRPKNYKKIKQLYSNRTISLAEAAKYLKVSKSTFRNWLTADKKLKSETENAF